MKEIVLSGIRATGQLHLGNYYGALSKFVRMQEEGIYVTGFYYPVVPKGQARIRVQLSAGHEREHLDKAIAAFIKVGKELSVIK